MMDYTVVQLERAKELACHHVREAGLNGNLVQAAEAMLLWQACIEAEPDESTREAMAAAGLHDLALIVEMSAFLRRN